MTFDVEALYALEERVIKEEEELQSVRPRRIRVVTNVDYNGRAEDEEILISDRFLAGNPSEKEMKDLLKHELLHYLYPDHGHSAEFMEAAERMKIADSYVYHGLIDEANKTFLEGRIRRIIDAQRGGEVIKIRRRPSWKGFRFGRSTDPMMTMVFRRFVFSDSTKAYPYIRSRTIDMVSPGKMG